ncbi:MAG TPA: 16S rRNA (cytosine(967)-C(5))-methyltransferase RsmB [Vicinamibacterales bacterium]|jgi:16S rRNA (cytosine967-C5)-methyltransferase|nr:16S rRNA (cytosine(967)-C(5))-methyltransferase RsmB [Vicinamibacterales bacterium]
MIGPARVAAYDILTSVSAGRADLPSAIAASRSGLHDERDRALVAEIATGVQRWRAALDHVIVYFSKRPIARLDDEIVEILRLSAYQLLHLTRVPAAAVVDDAVNLAKRAGKTSASGLVNAVLRAISRARTALPLPVRPADPLDREAALQYLSITLSHPRWLAERWYDRIGFDATEQWLRFNNTAAPLTLRANRLRVTPADLVTKLKAEDVTVSSGVFAPDALIVLEGHPLRGSGPEQGWFVVQDEASQLVALLAGDHPGRRVLDTCASPGGKTTAMAAAMGADDLIVACDVRDRRVDLLRRTIAASGASNVRIVRADLLQPLPFSALFDCVLVDAPCSGLGTLRRDPDIRWRRRESDLAVLADAQRLMLQHAAAAVAEGGRLVYATCSSEPEENEAVAEAFVRGTPSFEAVDARVAAPRLPAAVVDTRGHLRTLPHVHGLEAFFGAVFRRT